MPNTLMDEANIEETQEAVVTLIEASKIPTEISQRVRAIETVLEENTKQLGETAEMSQKIRSLETVLEANTKQLAETTNDDGLVGGVREGDGEGCGCGSGVLSHIGRRPGSGSKERYMEAIPKILKGNHLPKAIKDVLSETLLWAYNIDGLNGKKSLKSFPKFFAVIIESISTLDGQQPAENALGHALSCVKNNANK
ncbi:uncharacterized protein LOC122625600 [Drosophila teissieri]|uniref:uncharacterized protein LOC122625600 n=1 Tax=Drosophila teissieri TaxID=7243 RepID=UPI001CBA1095|nr:uncharacterized protein LOC122625600 [Drosophila teissieri]